MSVYKPPGIQAFLASVFLLVGGWFIGKVAYHWLTGVPMMFASSRGSHETHPGTAWDLSMYIAFGLIALYGGITSLLNYLNAKAILDDDGLTILNLVGKVKNKVAWSEITEVKKCTAGRGGVFYDVVAGSRRIMLSGYRDMPALIADIGKHAPNAQMPPG